MKHSDIKKLFAAGLISAEQRGQIIEHFKLKPEGSRFMVIISFLGAVLVVCGLVLLIAANWEEIPRGVKIAVGLALMLGAHAGGWYLREVRREYRKTGEALHLVGSGLWLGNIALIGQIYHLSSRLPNAFLLWWVGIAALPWLLRSKAQHILVLLAFGLWVGMEANEQGSWLFLGHSELQILYYAALGLICLGAGYCLRRSSFDDFASPTEKLGLLGFHVFAYPLTWGDFFDGHAAAAGMAAKAFVGLGALAVILLAFGLKAEERLTRQWRWTWGLALLGGFALLAGAMFRTCPTYSTWPRPEDWYHWLAAGVLFVFCLLQIQVGVQTRSAFVVNLGIVFIALNIIATYLTLIESMAKTGLVFVVSGVFLMVFAVYLEKQRRALMARINASPA